MISGKYFRILELEPGATLSSARTAFHRAAKRNHPDLFPEEKRHSQQLRMMKINEAYLSIVAEMTATAGAAATAAGSDESGRSGVKNSAREPAEMYSERRFESPETKTVGHLKDPAYVYYKLGFTHFTDGRKTFFQRYRKESNRFRYTLDNRDLLNLAIACLKLFEKSYMYFTRVVENHSDSVWYHDSVTKIAYLERYNEIYLRICNSITAQLASAQRREPPSGC
jgi:hypothetical protein